MITVHLEPKGNTVELHDLRTALGLLNRLKLRPTMALVIRDGQLLTPDRPLFHGDEITVRTVTSAG